MALSSLRTALARWGLIVVLALTVGIGAIPAGGASAAVPRYTCDQALALGQAAFTTGQVLLALGNPTAAMYYFGKADSFYTYC